MSETEKVADIIWRSISKFHVGTVFGVLGPEIDPLISAMRKAGGKYIQVHNEKSAGVMASVTSFLTGKLGVCLVAVMPGVVTLAPGLAEAVADRTPVLAISGQVETFHCGTDYTQESDDIAVLKPLTIYGQMIVAPESAGLITSIACRTALAKRGVAHIDIPVDVLETQAKKDWDVSMPDDEYATPYPSEASLKKAADILDSSQSVIIVAGRGASGCGELLTRLSQVLAAPVFQTYSCFDVMPSNSPSNMGVAWTISASLRRVAEKADVVLLVGTDYPYVRNIFPADAKKIQIEIDQSNMGRRTRIDAQVVGGARESLQGLMQLVQQHKTSYFDFVTKEMSKVRSAIDENTRDTSKPINPFYAVKAIEASIKEDSIIALEGAGASRYFAYCFNVKKHRILHGGRFGILGFGLPAAIAAKLVHPEKDVIAVSGDYGMMYSMAEMMTAVKNEIAVKVVVFNNRTQASESFHAAFPKGLDIQEDFSFYKFAEACGVYGRRVEDPSELPSAARDVLSREGVALLEIMTSPKSMPQTVGQG